MKKYWIVIILIILLTGCISNKVEDDVYSSENLLESNKTFNNQIEQLKLESKRNSDEILRLEAELKEKEETISIMNFEKENLRFLSELSLEFSRARASADIDKLKSLVSNNIEIVERDNEIFGKYTVDEYEIEYPLYIKNRINRYKDMQINGYYYNKEEDEFNVIVQEYFMNEQKEIIGIGYVYLYVHRIDNEWKINRFEYDI